ncbi:hypothetical protein TNCV_539071 [Trichonephila clavipes]|nr:hypothetical protein TNCV_539071 [Trichonephila clavipes]
MKWAGHVLRMNEDHTTKKVFNAQPIDTRRKGKQNLRRNDSLEKYILVLRTKNWRTSGKSFLRRLMPILGCLATEEGSLYKQSSLFTSRSVVHKPRDQVRRSNSARPYKEH